MSVSSVRRSSRPSFPPDRLSYSSLPDLVSSSDDDSSSSDEEFEIPMAPPTPHLSHSLVSSFFEGKADIEPYIPPLSLPLPHHIPCLSVVTYNPTSFSYYTSHRNKFTAELRALAAKNDILYFQETKLLAKENSAHRGTVPKHTLFFSNNPANREVVGLNTCTAGIVTAIRTSILNDFFAIVVELPVELQGHVLVIRLESKISNVKINLINLRLISTSNDKLNEQEKQIEMLGKSLLSFPAAFTFLGGDFNFVERQEDTTSAFTEIERPFWREFLLTHKLQVVKNDVHSFFHIPTNPDSQRRSANLDRFYISHSEADLAVVSPFVTSDVSALASLRKKGLFEKSINGDGFNAHIPVALRFVPVTREKSKVRRINDLVLDSPNFPSLFKLSFKKALEANPSATPLEELDFFRKAIHSASKSIALESKNEIDMVTLFQKAVTLYRKLSSPNHTDEDVIKITENFPILNNLLSRSCEGWILDDLKILINSIFKNIGTPDENFCADEEDPPPLRKGDSAQRVNPLKTLKIILPSTRNKLKVLKATPGSEPSANPNIVGPIIKKHYQKVWENVSKGADRGEIIDEYLQGYDRTIDKN